MSLSVTYSDLQKEVARQLGWPRDPGNWSTVQDDDFELIIDSGMRKFYSGEIVGEAKSHNWSFLYPLASIELTPAYTTGTIEVDSGTITLSSGTWPTWAAQGQIAFTSGGVDYVYDIDTRTSGSEVTITDVSLTVASGTSYTLRRLYYDLPSDFGGMYGDGFAYRRDQDYHLPEIKIVGESQIRLRDREVTGEIYPRMASITPNGATGWQVRFYPLPQSAYVVEYRYKVEPPALSSGNTTPYGGSYCAEAIVAAVLDSAVQRVHQSDELHDRFLSAMRQAVFHDRRNFSALTAGRGSSGNRSYTLETARRKTGVDNITLSFG